MKFSEQFPSLKGKGTDDVKVDCMFELIFHYSDIQKYCLDKQRVKEVFYPYLKMLKDMEDSIYYSELKERLKELGLEDEEC